MVVGDGQANAGPGAQRLGGGGRDVPPCLIAAPGLNDIDRVVDRIEGHDIDHTIDRVKPIKGALRTFDHFDLANFRQFDRQSRPEDFTERVAIDLPAVDHHHDPAGQWADIAAHAEIGHPHRFMGDVDAGQPSQQSRNIAGT